MENENTFVLLFDYDSMLYKAVYKITSTIDYKSTKYPNSGLIRKWFDDGRNREWMEKEIVQLAWNRLEQMGNNIMQEIENSGIEIFGVEYFLTECSESVRKKASPIYKANRKTNKWVSLLRETLIKTNVFLWDNKWEADDLIKDRSIHYGIDKCVIASPDKDMDTIPGYHFDYYQPIPKKVNGKYPVDWNGYRIVLPCRGIKHISKKESEKFFWKQMLMGDSCDNIKGIPRIGKVKAEKILSDSTNHRQTVLSVYIDKFGESEGIKQFNLHLLLLGLGINHRVKHEESSLMRAAKTAEKVINDSQQHLLNAILDKKL